MENSKFNFQSASSYLALVISLAALFVSIYEANLLRAHEKMMVWPYVTLSSNYSGKGFSIQLENDGIGPAIIKSVQVQHEGEVVKTWEALLKKVKSDHNLGYDILKMTEINKIVIKAGEVITGFNMPWNEESRFIASKLSDLRFKVCYCSVADECWVYDSEKEETTKEKVVFESSFER